MSNFTFSKKIPWAIVLRVFALTIILLITIFIIQWLPAQIHKLKQGRVEGISYKYERTSGDEWVGDSAWLEREGVSGEVVVYSADKEAMGVGIFPGSIVLNSEALTTGEIGSPVTLFVKYGNLPVREITLTRRQSYSSIPTLSNFLGLSPLVRLYFAIIFLCVAVLITGIGGIVAFWFQSDAWLAFFVVGAITNLFIPLQNNPSWLLFWSYIPAGMILFLLLFPNGKLNPKWSWMLVFLPLSKNINNNALGRAYLPIWPEYVYNFWSQHRLHIFLVIASILGYRYRKELTSTERRRMAWLILGLILISTRWQWLAFLGVPIGFIQKFNWFTLWTNGGIANVFLSSLFSYGVATSLLLILGVFSYRYRNTFTPMEQQQAKWLILGTFTFILLATILKIFSACYFSLIQQNQSDAAIKLSDKIFLLAIVFLIFCVISALRRFRLWDVDTFINRVLVYGALTIIGGEICQLSVTFIHRTVGSASANQSAFLIFPIAIFLIVTTYKPVRTWLQKLADKFFPPERINFPDAFLEFTPDLRGYFTPSRLSKVLAEKSVEQMEVTYASVFLKNTSGKLQHIKTAFTGKKAPKPVIEKRALSELEEGEIIMPDSNSNYSIIIPLAVPRGKKQNIIGALLLGSRLNELGYSTEMKKKLKKFGEEVGTSLYIAQIKNKDKAAKSPHYKAD